VGEVSKFVLPNEAGLPQIRGVVNMGGRHVAIYCIHLVSPGGVRHVALGRLQLADLLETLSREPLPAVLGGDFNFTETTPQAAALADAGFGDAYALGGWGRGSTWRSVGLLRWAPGVRLDHIYLSSALTCNQCRVGRRTGSDHRPVVATIGFAKGE
jgi:endonuclease/exonuclease/phosphatase (EEP) superfamily protein YafD